MPSSLGTAGGTVAAQAARRFAAMDFTVGGG
jgi:hypothetical protein